MDLIGIGLIFVSCSAPVTVAIIRRNGNGNGKHHVTAREFDSFKAEIGDALVEIRYSVDRLEDLIRSRL
jgi:hypothetical protein